MYTSLLQGPRIKQQIQSGAGHMRMSSTLTSAELIVFNHPVAISFLISAIAFAGFRPLGHVREQFKMVWHLYKLMLLSRASLR